MHRMEEVFEDITKELFEPKNVLANLIESELVNIGIELTNLQLKHLQDQLILIGDKGMLSFDFSDKQIKSAGYSSESELEKHVSKIFSSLHVAVDDLVNNVDEILEDTMNDVSDKMAASMIDGLQAEMPSMLNNRKSIHLNFYEDMASLWGSALGYLEGLIVIAEESTEKVSERDDAYFENTHTLSLLIAMQAKSIQVSREILTLLRNGFPDGAQARWRKLHEIAVISTFIANHGNELAESYEEHQSIESYRAAIQYNEYYSQLSGEKISASEMDVLKKDYDQLMFKHGDSYRHEYGWASSVLDMKKPTFKDIELSVGLDHHRPYYKLASADIHANPSGVFTTLGLFPEDDFLLTGPTNLGVCQPAQSTIISLNIITVNLLSYAPSLDCIVLCKVLKEFGKLAEDEFLTIDEEIHLAKQDNEKSKIIRDRPRFYGRQQTVKNKPDIHNCETVQINNNLSTLTALITAKTL